MDYVPGKVRRLSSNPWFLLGAGIGSIVSLPLTLVLGVWPDALRAERIKEYLLPAAVVLATTLWVSFVIALYHSFQAYRALRLACYIRHEISHAYRNAHGKRRLSPTSNPVPDFEQGSREIEVLRTVAQKIASMFRELLGVPCMVEVYLCTPDADTCCLVALSERSSQREQDWERNFVVHKDKNTAFVEARVRKPSGTSCFFSGDLKSLAAEGKYNDQRDNWQYCYQSRLIVPIRYRDQELGFLALDTKSRHRINDTYHVEVLASLADDMYVFLHEIRSTLPASSSTSVAMQALGK